MSARIISSLGYATSEPENKWVQNPKMEPISVRHTFCAVLLDDVECKNDLLQRIVIVIDRDAAFEHDLGNERRSIAKRCDIERYLR